MSTPSRTRGRPPLPLDRIIATAIDILDEQGAEALSMRSLAQALGSGTATLYRHFAGRDDVIARVVDSVMSEAHIESENLSDVTWQQACETLAHTMFGVLRNHPNVAALMVDRVPAGPYMLALRERALTRLLEAGFAPPLALQAWATLARYVLGFGSQITAADAEPPATWAEIDVTELPSTMAVAAYFPISLEKEFSFGLESLIIGIEHQLNRKPSRRTSTHRT